MALKDYLMPKSTFFEAGTSLSGKSFKKWQILSGIFNLVTSCLKAAGMLLAGMLASDTAIFWHALTAAAWRTPAKHSIWQ